MGLSLHVKDGYLGTDVGAAVTRRGQLVTAPISFNKSYFQTMTATSTAYNFIKPVSDHQFVIDGLVYSSDKNVSSTNGAVISLFEADPPTSTTPLVEIIRVDLGRLERDSLTGLNMITDPAVWINGVTDDATTNVTLLGYYVRVEN